MPPRLLILPLLCSLGLPLALFAGEISKSELGRLVQAQQNAQKTGICELHNIKMSKGAVPMRWGVALPPGRDNPTFQYRMQHFPNYVEFIEGGCCIVPGKKSETVFICSKCKEAAIAWKKVR